MRNQLNGAAGNIVGTSSVGDRVTHLVFLLSAILVVLAAVNAVFTTWATVIDAERPTALAQSPRRHPAPGQHRADRAPSSCPALVAACIGIPVGLALYELAGGHVDQASPPLLWLLAVIPGTLIAVALLTAIPARIAAHRPVAEVLRSE